MNTCLSMCLYPIAIIPQITRVPNVPWDTTSSFALSLSPPPHKYRTVNLFTHPRYSRFLSALLLLLLEAFGGQQTCLLIRKLHPRWILRVAILLPHVEWNKKVCLLHRSPFKCLTQFYITVLFPSHLLIYCHILPRSLTKTNDNLIGICVSKKFGCK